MRLKLSVTSPVDQLFKKIEQRPALAVTISIVWLLLINWIAFGWNLGNIGLIDETERTFKTGMIVSATVFRVYDSNGDKPARIVCRLENGIDANIGENDADFFNHGGDRLSNSIDVGSIITGRIAAIKFGEGKNGEKF